MSPKTMKVMKNMKAMKCGMQTKQTPLNVSSSVQWPFLWPSQMRSPWPSFCGSAFLRSRCLEWCTFWWFRLGGRISRIFWVWATVTETTLAFLWAKKRECLFWDAARRAIDNWEWHVDSSPLRKIRRSQSLWWNSTRSCMKSCWPNLEFPHCPNRERSRQRTNQLLHAIEPINRSRIKQCKMIQLPNV